MKLKKMSGEHAKVILQDILDNLAEIEKDDLTTLELDIIRVCVEKEDILPRRGCEDIILNAERNL
jgi:hypothetical protein